MRHEILIFDLIFYPTYYQMSYMFYDAAAFNQNLYHFGDNWPYSSVARMFVGTACTDLDSPASESGPWCSRPSNAVY